ncbi:MAG: hypothetical protein ACT4PX_02545 [Actinomycetota bacterium]
MRSPRYIAYAAAAATAAAVLLGLAFAPGGATAAPAFAHWGQRSLVISDRTGDAGWQAATRRAVDTWNAVGADVRLAWSEGGVGCEAEGTTIPVCRDILQRGWKGAAHFYHAPDGHLGGARIRMAADRSFSQAEKDTLACHEIGHALGLDHAGSSASCLTQGSVSATPDGADADALRTAYAHQG